MKRLVLFTALIFVVTVAYAGPPEEIVIKAGTRHTGDIRMEIGNVRVLEDADVAGNIFIEEGDLFLSPNVQVIGSITLTIKKGNIRLMESAEVQGNIFIEEGDLFIGSEVDIVGSITIKKGNIFIKDNVDLTREILLLNGNFEMGNKNVLMNYVMNGGGAVSMGDGNTVYGDITAASLKKGRNNDLRGKFHQTKPK